ncbi:MAG: flagellar basal body L-ring protein FlgH [Gemmatimonadaceae bacterium]|nr:flagellar basal body L-ring protein FlgH [Gemmatimonadaceae bacterium]
MIHHCDVIATPRRVTVIPTVPAAEPAPKVPRLAIAAAAVVALLVLGAAQLGAQAAARPDSAKAAPAARNLNWTSDRRTFAVGDVIQVLVDEYALAQATKDNTNSASRSRQLGVQVEPPSLPGSGAAIGDVAGSVQTGDAGASMQRGNATRNTRYVGQLAVRVVAVTPEGLLQVKGTKMIDVDKNKATLTLSGFLRPIDVGSRDAVGSEAIADAQISYSAKGSLGKPKNGLVGKLIGLFWP